MQQFPNMKVTSDLFICCSQLLSFQNGECCDHDTSDSFSFNVELMEQIELLQHVLGIHEPLRNRERVVIIIAA
jgi:hypothetical protein